MSRTNVRQRDILDISNWLLAAPQGVTGRQVVVAWDDADHTNLVSTTFKDETGATVAVVTANVDSSTQTTFTRSG